MGSPFCGGLVVMLRLIVAFALVVTALSAPTWIKKLSMLASAGETTSCHCTGCTTPFWESQNYPGNISKAECFEMCSQNSHNIATNAPSYQDQALTGAAGAIGDATENKIDCRFALYDSALPVNCKHRDYHEIGNGHCVDSNNKRPPHCWTDSHQHPHILSEGSCRGACDAVSGCTAYEWGQTGGYCQLIWVPMDGEEGGGISSTNNVQNANSTGSCSSDVLSGWKYNLAGDSGYDGGSIDKAYGSTGGKCMLKHHGTDPHCTHDSFQKCWLYDARANPSASSGGQSQYSCYKK